MGVGKEDEPMDVRYRPRLGQPRSLVEHAVQHVWRHKLLWYVAVIVTATLITQIIAELGL